MIAFLSRCLAGLAMVMWLPLAMAQPRAMTVSADGADGAFRSVQAAIDSVPENNTQPQLIIIRPGTYKELIRVPKKKTQLTLRAEDPDASKTVLTFDLHANIIPPAATQPIGTSGTPSTSIEADDFTAENITFENSAGDAGQAVALKIVGDRGVFRNCRFLGYQDTLYADAGRHYFVHCHIEGRVDFIFGGATAVFERCTIHSRNGGYITAARTPPDQPHGFVFLDCTLTGEGDAAYLGRPWQWDRGRNAAVAFIRTKMGPHIRPEAWNRWDRPGNPNTQPANTARYREFASTDLNGNPLDVSARVDWSRQLTPAEAAELTVQTILAGSDNWDPTTQSDPTP